MDEMKAAIERLRFAVGTLPGTSPALSEAESEQRPAPERWTKKEVIGHLIDSASNNHQRLGARPTRLRAGPSPLRAGRTGCASRSTRGARWADLIDLWRAYNTHIIHVAENMPEQGRALDVPGRRRG